MIHSRRVSRQLYSLKRRHAVEVTLREYVQAEINYEDGTLDEGLGPDCTIKALVLNDQAAREFLRGRPGQFDNRAEYVKIDYVVILDKRDVPFEINGDTRVTYDCKEYEVNDIVTDVSAGTMLFIRGVSNGVG